MKFKNLEELIEKLEEIENGKIDLDEGIKIISFVLRKILDTASKKSKSKIKKHLDLYI